MEGNEDVVVHTARRSTDRHVTVDALRSPEEHDGLVDEVASQVEEYAGAGSRLPIVLPGSPGIVVPRRSSLWLPTTDEPFSPGCQPAVAPWPATIRGSAGASRHPDRPSCDTL